MNALKPMHILVLVIIVLLLFGAKRLPDLAKSVGQSLKIFKNEVKDLTEDNDTPPPAATPATVVVPPVAAPQAVADPPAAAPHPERPAQAPAAGGDQPSS
ncbi:Sec-independent protein translocase subunit TatA [Cellulomonas timonensis]|uniref:Sec-independent protein translocase subunit TatA n=1 Tax=Cellulomonas timonensis TaxID=1689271 RepID=UPI0009EDF429|nr:Sec-independent protein translocase subunit TatA [Cellulomonas timonensis]